MSAEGKHRLDGTLVRALGPLTPMKGWSPTDGQRCMDAFQNAIVVLIVLIGRVTARWMLWRGGDNAVVEDIWSLINSYSRIDCRDNRLEASFNPVSPRVDVVYKN